MNTSEQKVLTTISKQAELLSNYAWLVTITQDSTQKAESMQWMLDLAEELNRVITEELPEVTHG